MINTAHLVPELDVLEEARQALTAIKLPPVTTLGDAQAQLVDRLVAGEKLTGQDLVDAMSTSMTGEQPHNAAQQALASAAGDLSRRIATVRNRDADIALAALGTQLTELWTAAQPLLTILDGAQTADEALRAGNADTWVQLTRIADDWATLRGAQRQWIVDGYGANTGQPEQGTIAVRDLDRFGIVSDAGRFPPLSTERNGAPRRQTMIGPSQSVRTPWSELDAVTFLTWARANSATPWLPTVAQLRAAATEHAQLIDDARLAAAGLDTPDKRRAAAERAAAARARLDRDVDDARDFAQQYLDPYVLN